MIDALGYRARIGILLPASNTIGQPEFEMMAPMGVTNQVVRMTPTPPGTSAGNLETYRGGLGAHIPVIEEAIKVVLHCTPSAIILAHAMDTFRGGVAGAKAMQEALAPSAKSIPVILPAFAFLEALRALGVRPGARLAALTPYWPKEDEDVRAFFTDAGYTMTRVLGFKCNGAAEIAGTTTERITGALRELAAENVAAILQPGTNMASLTVAARSQDSLGVPVICCNTACYWQALRLVGVRDRRMGFGPLLADH
jgi:maleate isomerase